MAMTARRIDADTALQWGLVDHLLPQEDFDAAAYAHVRRLAAGPTRAIGAVPGLLRKSFDTPRDEMLAAERRYQRHCLTSADFIEAATAAMQGRPPEFTGR
jgi:enoyl-CoA hydratase/carnithine racemase